MTENDKTTKTDQNIQKVLIREYNSNEIIVEAGAPYNRFFVILQGAVEILFANTRIRLLKAGDIFGIEYFYLKRPYSTTATAMTNARIASYDVSMLNEIVYNRPHLMQQLLGSVARQLEQTAQIISKHMTGEYMIASPEQPLQAAATDDDGMDITITSLKPGETNFHDDILCYFIEESRELLDDLLKIGESLKLVGIPNQKESAKLVEFAQKLNRLIGGTASMGFGQFTQLSRKTSLLANRCAEIRELSIRIVISNLNLIVATLANCFKNLDAIKQAENMIPALDQRLDICMTAVGIASPDIKTQNEIDDMFTVLRDKQAQHA